MKKLALLSLFTTSIFAADATILKNISTNFTKNTGVMVFDVKDSVVEGLYEVSTENGLYYADEAARFVFEGSIFDSQNGFKDITEAAKGKARLEQLRAFEDDMIVFKAKEEKYKITVFTDVTCPYCIKLHNEIDDYNKLGVTVRLLAFPRGGINSSGFHRMVNIWCSEDQLTAFEEDLKHNKTKEKATCSDHNIEGQYNLGKQFGVTGTPSVLLENGELKPGYRSAKAMLAVLEESIGKK